jgi:osmotically-inducible protein OsmY
VSHRTPGCRAPFVAVAAAVVAAVVAAGCATQPPRTEGERAADDELAARVDRALLSDSAMYARHIDVDATQGVVRLSGFVWSSDDLYEAKRVAANVPGVKAVIDQLELMVGGRTGAR